MESQDKLKLTEFETKYEVDEKLLHPFKDLASKLDSKKFVYVEGPDVFFTKKGEDKLFARYRKADNGDSRSEFTIKEKINPDTNVRRIEVNWKVDGTPYAEIAKGAELLGFRFNTTIWKGCHIYKLEDATLVFYTVRDSENKLYHFIEIEVCEEMLKDMTADMAWDVIKKYESVLAPLGITAQKRKRKSLYEMFKKSDEELDKMYVNSVKLEKAKIDESNKSG